MKKILVLILASVVSSTPLRAQTPPSVPGVFVAVGYGGFRGWSSDGQHWTAERWSAKNEDDDNIIFSVAYRDGIFLCSGGGAGKGFILRSTDGEHWDEVLTNRWRITGVLTLEDRFFSVFNNHFQISTNGLDWQTLAEADTRSKDGMGFGFFRRWATGNGAVVFAGDYELTRGRPRVGWIGGTLKGTTAMTLEKQSGDVTGLDFGNGRFVACTQDGNILLSTNGLHFKFVESTGDRHEGDSVRFYNGAFYLRGHAGMQTSNDGEHWEHLEHSLRIPHAVAPGGTAIDYDWSGIKVATDGKSFHKASVPVDPTGICAVTYGVPLTPPTR